MAWWGNKEEAPPELKDLTPAQIAQAVKDSAALRTELDTAKSKALELEGKLGEFDQIKAKLAQLEAAATPPSTQREDPNRRVSVLEDEDAAFNQRLNPMLNAVVSIGQQHARSMFEGGLTAVERKIYAKYKGELDEALKAAGPASADAAIVQNYWNMVKGRHLDEITKAAAEGNEFFAAEVTGNQFAGPGSTSPNLGQGDKLTDTELKTCKNMGIKPEDYLAQRKEMVIYHG